MVASCALVLLAAGCSDDGPAGPEGLRFGQIGEVRLELKVPLRFGEGELSQALVWNSAGPYILRESISYQGVVGDESETRVTDNSERLAGDYATWIAQVNELPALTLFTPELDPDLDPTCGIGRSRIVLEIHDAVRGETSRWTRCVAGSLGDLDRTGAGPDPQAARVAQAVELLRDRVFGLQEGEEFVSTYRGSLPFATVDRGEDSEAELDESFAITDAGAWSAFWDEHAPEAGPAPEIDFEQDVIVVAAVGVRTEAGEEVEVRRVIPIDQGTLVTLFERVPGNFCSPASQTHVPFHIIRAPRVPLPVVFSEVTVERVPCGL